MPETLAGSHRMKLPSPPEVAVATVVAPDLAVTTTALTPASVPSLVPLFAVPEPTPVSANTVPVRREPL